MELVLIDFSWFGLAWLGLVRLVGLVLGCVRNKNAGLFFGAAALQGWFGFRAVLVVLAVASRAGRAGRACRAACASRASSAGRAGRVLMCS